MKATTTFGHIVLPVTPGTGTPAACTGSEDRAVTLSTFGPGTPAVPGLPSGLPTGATAFTLCGNENTAGLATVQVQVISNSAIQATGTVQISGTVATMELAADPASIDEDSGATVVTATLKDGSGNIVGDNTPVVFSAGGTDDVSVVGQRRSVLCRHRRHHGLLVDGRGQGHRSGDGVTGDVRAQRFGRSINVSAIVPGTTVAATINIPVTGGGERRRYASSDRRLHGDPEQPVHLRP